MRSILVHADASAALDARLETALSLGRQHNAHVRFMISTAFRNFIAMDPFGGAYLASGAMAAVQEQDSKLAEQLAEKLAGEDVASDVVQADGDVVAVMASAAALADLAIVSLNGWGEPGGPSTLAGDLALAVSTPVLALPKAAKMLDLEAPAMIAWNGSPQAANAIRAAVPLLIGRKQVSLVVVGDDDGGLAAEDALRYLSRHDIHAELHMVPPVEETVDMALERAALELKVELIVMGAFGRSRLRETLFGGTTKYLVEGGQFALLLAH